MVQIFLTYTASKFVIYKLCFVFVLANFCIFLSMQVLVGAQGRAEGRRLHLPQKVALQCDPSFHFFLLGFPLFPFAIPFFLAVLSFLPSFLPRLPSFAPSFWLFASCLDFYDFTLILLLIPNPFCSSLSDLSPHGHPTVPVPITNVKLQPTDPPLQTTRSHWQWWKKSDLPKPINVPESNLAEWWAKN